MAAKTASGCCCDGLATREQSRPHPGPWCALVVAMTSGARGLASRRSRKTPESTDAVVAQVVAESRRSQVLPLQVEDVSILRTTAEILGDSRSEPEVGHRTCQEHVAIRHRDLAQRGGPGILACHARHRRSRGEDAEGLPRSVGGRPETPPQRHPGRTTPPRHASRTGPVWRTAGGPRSPGAAICATLRNGTRLARPKPSPRSWSRPRSKPPRTPAAESTT